jgi:hypothetical protein
MFGLRKRKKEEKKTQKSINKLELGFSPNLFIGFPQPKHVICEGFDLEKCFFLFASELCLCDL